jgi:hypothetical protein
MISEQSKKLIDKKWPGVKDNKILLQNAREELINYAYMFSVPEDANDKFLAKAIRKTKSIRFVAGGCVIFAGLVFIDEGINVGDIAAFAGLFEKLVVAFILYWFYKSKMKLITCYDELMSKSANTEGNEEKQEA